MDRFLVNPRPKPQPKPMPKPANLMEEVISIKHDESLVENPGLHAVAWEVPVIIRGVRRTGRNAGNGYERTKYLPVTTLNATLSRQSDGLSEFQVRRNVKAAVLAQLGNPEPNDIIMELSDETYYLDPAREWTFSSQVMQVVNDQVEVEAILEQPAGRLLSAVLRRRHPGVRLRAAAGQALRGQAARGADAPAAAGGAVGLRRDLPEQQVAGAGRQPQGDPRVLRVARGPDVLRGLPGPPAGQVRAYRQGAAGRGLHELERPRLLLQVRPHRREVRAGPGTGATGSRAKPPSSRSGGSGRARSRAVTSTPRTWRGSGASCWPRATARRWSCAALPAPPRPRRRGLRDLQSRRGRGGAGGLDGAAEAPLPGPAPRGRGERGLPPRIAGGRPRRAGPPVQAARPPSTGRPASWTTSSPCTSPIPLRPKPSRPSALSVTGTKQPWSSPTPRRSSPASAGGPTRPTWSRPGSPRWSSTSTATNRTGSVTGSTWFGAARTPWPTPSSRCRSSAPRTTSSRPAKATWRTSPTWS